MDTAVIETAYRDWWEESYKRPPNPQAVMTHVAFTQHMLELIKLIEVVDGYPYRARALLAQPVAEGPTDEEWDALVVRAWDQYETVGYQGERFMYDSDFGNALDFVRRELARWGADQELGAEDLADGEAAELAAELRHFVAERKKMRGLDPETIYSIHQGDAEKEAHLRVNRLLRAAELLERPRGHQ